MTVIVIWLDVECFFFTLRTPLQTLVTIAGNGAEMITRIMRLPWPLNPAWCFDVRPATTGCIHVPHFSARKHAPALRVQPTWPKWEVGCKKIPNFDEKSPKKPLREVTATPTPISGAYSPEPMIQQEQLDRCYESLQKDSTLVDQGLGSPW